MKACAMTERQASIWSVLSMSKTNCGFFRMFTQNRRGRLWDGGTEAVGAHPKGRAARPRGQAGFTPQGWCSLLTRWNL